MKKTIVFILFVLALTLILSGCGGGGGGGDKPGSLTVTFHFRNSKDNSGISGLKVGYTEPNTTNEIISPESGSDGDITVTLTKSGTYTIQHLYVEGIATPFSVVKPVDVSKDDVINGNHTAQHTIIIDTAKQEIISIDNEPFTN